MDMQQAYKAAEKTRVTWFSMSVAGLALEIIGLVLLMRGSTVPGAICAGIGLLWWLVIKSVGNRRYGKLCAGLAVRYGLGMDDAQALPIQKGEDPGFPTDVMLPPGQSASCRPLFMHPHRGTVGGAPVLLCEATVGYDARNYVSGTLAALSVRCGLPAALALYGKPYGGVPVSAFKDLTNVDTGDGQYLLLARPKAAFAQPVLDALAQFDEKHDKKAVLRIEDDRIVLFLPNQFYSGTWGLARPMPQDAVEVSPLPALDDLAALLKQLTARPEEA